MLQRFAKFLEVREATEEEVKGAFVGDDEAIPKRDRQESLLPEIEGDEDNVLNHQVQVGASTRHVEMPSDSLGMPQASADNHAYVGRDHLARVQQYRAVTGGYENPVGRPEIFQSELHTPKSYQSHLLGQHGGREGLTGSFSNSIVAAPQTSLFGGDDALSEVSLESTDDFAESSAAERLKRSSQPPQQNMPRLATTVKIDRSRQLVPDAKPRLLDDSLASALTQVDAFKSDQYDDILRAWLDDGNIRSTSQTPRSTNHTPLFSMQSMNNQSSSREAELESKLKLLEQQLEQATLEKRSLETELEAEREKHGRQIVELENERRDMEARLMMKETKTLAADLLLSSRNSGELNFSKQDDFLKHCLRLVRRLEEDKDPSSEEGRASEDARLSQIAGRQFAAMSAKLIANEQRIKDEKLVLKNILLSWLERGERKDAFEILASAFEFTPEDRKRVHAKPAWVRSAALGGRVSFGESIADFVRDEIS